MANVRIKDQATDTALSAGDYVIVDSESEGTRKYDLGALAARVDEIESGQSGGSGLTQTEKDLILELFSKAAYADSDAGTAYDTLETLWTTTTRTITYNLSYVSSSNSSTTIEDGSSYSTTLTATGGRTINTVSVKMGGVDVTASVYSSGTISIPSVTGNIVITATAVTSVDSITAVYTQSGTVYDTDSLDSLKDDLVVTANYSGGSSTVVTDYTLSGTLNEGTSTITVSYGGKTDTFSVTVTHYVEGWLYHFDQSLASSGSEDFGFQWRDTSAQATYSTGHDGTGYSYLHKVEEEGTGATEVNSIYANGFTPPDWSGDFTWGMWYKSETNKYGQLLCPFTVGTTSGKAALTNVVTDVASGWSVTRTQIQKTVEGCRIWHSNETLEIRIISTGLTYGAAYNVTYPSDFDTTQWHHYALTRKNGIIRLFIDGEVIFKLSDTHSLLFANQVAIGGYFSNAGDTTPAVQGRQTYNDDLFIAEYCKWDSAFDPSAITY